MRCALYKLAADVCRSVLVRAGCDGAVTFLAMGARETGRPVAGSFDKQPGPARSGTRESTCVP